jgi:putative selenium metabolism hydrolase
VGSETKRRGIIESKAVSYRDYTADNLSQIVQIPSLSGEEGAVIARLGAMLEEANFDEVRVDGLGNLIGRVGHGPRVLAIDAHIDIVDTGDLSRWELDPFSGLVRDGKVFGRGAVDQKGGAAAMVTAGRILKELGYDGQFSVYFTFTVMEEDCDGLCWKYLIEEENLLPDYVCLTEPTNLGLYRGHRGRVEIELHFSGLSAHGSAPERGDNAIYKGCRAALEIEKLHQRLRDDEFLGKGSVAVTQFSSRSPSLCAIPDGCLLHLDRRLTWGETMESAIQEVAQTVGGEARIVVPSYNRPSYTGTVFTQEKYFPTWKLAEDHPLVQAGVRTAASILGEPARIGKWTFSTNGVAICGRHGIPCIGFGPGNEELAHAPNEHIAIDHLERAAAFYALLPYVLEGQEAL